MLTQLYIDLIGECVWYIKKDGDIPSEIWPIPAGWINSRPGDNDGQNYFEVSVSKGNMIPKKVNISDVVWFRVPDPDSPYSNTVGVAEALGDELESDEYATHHIKSFFMNRARPEIIVTNTGLDEEETKDLEERWLSKFRGFWKANRPAFFSKDVTVTEVGGKFKDMELVSLRKWQRDVVLQAVGMPPEILGVLESSNRATINTAAFIFAKWVLTPRLELIRATLQNQLVPMFDEKIILEYASPVEEDREFALSVRKAAPWAFTVDNWRAVNGEPEVPEGNGKVFMVPAGMQPVKETELASFVSPYASGNQQSQTVDNPK